MTEIAFTAGLRGNRRERQGAVVGARPDLLHRDLTQAIIQAFHDTYNELGRGFLESVYEAALADVLRGRGLRIQRQHPVAVHFRGRTMGRFFADMLVDGVVVVELKVADTLHPEHQAQLLNYLKATRLEVGLLLNFGAKPQFRRLVMSNARKRSLAASFPPIPAMTRG